MTIAILYFFVMVLKFYLKNFKLLLVKKRRDIDFPDSKSNKILKNHCHALIFARNDLRFFVYFGTITQKKYKIAIGKFCL